MYSVEVNPLNMKGRELKHVFENVKINANETTPISHDYMSGELEVGVQTSTGELVDATIKVTAAEDKTYVAGGRTYTSVSSNPKTIIVLPGLYNVEIKTLGKHKGNTLTDQVEVKAGGVSSKIFKID